MQTNTLKNLAKDVGDDAHSMLNRATNGISDAAHTIGSQVRSFVSTANDEIKDAAETVTTQIRKSPVQSAAIALGVGVILGMLFRK